MEDSIPKPSSKHSPSQWGHDVNNPPAVPVDGERNGAHCSAASAGGDDGSATDGGWSTRARAIWRGRRLGERVSRD